jgi:hypothetical protein
MRHIGGAGSLVAFACHWSRVLSGRVLLGGQSVGVGGERFGGDAAEASDPDGVDVALLALGTRLHPKTGALCAYYLCGHLAGEPKNRDPAENAAATWAPVARLPDFIPTTSIYPPILDALGAAHV